MAKSRAWILTFTQTNSLINLRLILSYYGILSPSRSTGKEVTSRVNLVWKIQRMVAEFHPTALQKDGAAGRSAGGFGVLPLVSEPLVNQTLLIQLRCTVGE